MNSKFFHFQKLNYFYFLFLSSWCLLTFSSLTLAQTQAVVTQPVPVSVAEAPTILDQTQFRSFLVQMIKVSALHHKNPSTTASTNTNDPQVSAQIAASMRKIFAENPEFLVWPSQALKEKDTHDFIENTLDNKLPSQFQIPGVPFVLPALTDQQKELLPQIAVKALMAYAPEFSKKSVEERMQLLQMVPDEAFLQTAEVINKQIEEIKFSELPAVKILRDPEKGVDLKNAPEQFADFFNILLEKYLDRFSLEDKREILLALLELPPESQDIQRLSVVLQHSGPVIQKFFQLFAKNVKSPLVSEIMDNLKSNIKPFPYEQAKEAIERSYGKKMDELFSYFNEKPVAAASVGQVHFAKLKGSAGKDGVEEEVVVKVRRPGIEEKAKREIAILLDLAPKEGTKQLVRRLAEALEEELDFNKEAANLKLGKVYRKKEIGIYAVKEIETLPSRKEVFVMEKAEGKTFDKLKTLSDLKKKSKGIQELLELWLKQAFLEEGFFHADLHSGNLFYTPRNNKVGYLLTLIDFGSVGKLTPEEKKGIIGLSLGIILKSPKTVLESFLFYDKLSSEVLDQFSSQIKEILNDENSDIAHKTNEIIGKALELKVNFPKNFIQFNRGKLFIDNHISEINRELDKYDPNKKIPRVAPDEIYVSVLTKGLSSDLFKLYFKLGKGRGLINKKTMSRLMRESVRPLIKEKVQSLFTTPKKKKPAVPCLTKGEAIGG